MTTVLGSVPAYHAGVGLTAYEDFGSSLPCMTKKEINSIALQHGGYATPELNDKLYLHYKGYRKIENLEEYTNLKAIWLDSNGFQKIENLDHLGSLRCLYLSRNLFSTIENLDNLKNLVQLDLSENRISHVKGLAVLPILESLNLAKNALSSAASISELMECKSLTMLDLSNNALNGEEVINVICNIATLLNFRIMGNPITGEISSFRKKIIVALKKLRYLDRPVFDVERKAAEAWSSGGRQAELKMIEYLKEQKKKEEREGMDDFRSWQERVRTKATEAIINRPPAERTSAEIERTRNSKLKAEREEEAAGERDMYRMIDFKCDVDSMVLTHDAHKTQEEKNVESVQDVKEEEKNTDSSGEIHSSSTHHKDSIDSNMLNLETIGSSPPLKKTNVYSGVGNNKHINKMKTSSDGVMTRTTESCSNHDQIGKNNEPATTSEIPADHVFTTLTAVSDTKPEVLVDHESIKDLKTGLPSMANREAEIDQDETAIVNQHFDRNINSWTREMDQCLIRCVLQSSHDYAKAAQLMTYNFDGYHPKYFTMERCRQRWYLVDSVDKDRKCQDVRPLQMYYSTSKKRASYAGEYYSLFSNCSIAFIFRS